MSLVWYTLWFVIAVGLLVTVHEFGHFWVARRLGFKVLRFSVGFGRPLWSRRVGPDRTEIAVAPIPLGGYVKLLDEREGPVPPEDLPRSFTRKHPFQRILVLLAGPAFNIIFAILVLAGIMCVNGITQILPIVGDVTAGSIAARAGLHSGDNIVALNGAPVSEQQDVIFGLLDAMSSRGDADLSVRGSDGQVRQVDLAVSDPATRRHLTALPELFTGLGFQFWEPPVPAQLGQVLADGPAARAGLQEGDRVLSVDGHPVKDWDDLVAQITPHPGGTVSLSFERDGATHTVQVEVGSVQVDGKYVGRIEAASPSDIPYPPSMVRHLSVSPVMAVGRATEEAWDMTALQGTLFWRMMLGQVSLKNLSGPVSIAEYAGQSASQGVSSFLDFLVLISLSLGFLNLLPIPILDGGQIVFQLVEWVKGTPLSDRAQAFGQQVGIALLILLMGVALFNDIARQFS
ncbi:MAG TPA: RIP metalloprotease RseP [Solirubrobacteraceae bacterium]|nr:RIP metalloprotease RseP [Solirubrobacteraceae bacterium]